MMLKRVTGKERALSLEEFWVRDELRMKVGGRLYRIRVCKCSHDCKIV